LQEVQSLTTRVSYFGCGKKMKEEPVKGHAKKGKGKKNAEKGEEES